MTQQILAFSCFFLVGGNPWAVRSFPFPFAIEARWEGLFRPDMKRLRFRTFRGFGVR